MTEDEMVRLHHRFNGHGLGQTLGAGDGLGGLVCCGSWGRKESDTTEQLLFLSVDGYLGCFHVLANVNSAAVSIGVHVFFQIMVFL